MSSNLKYRLNYPVSKLTQPFLEASIIKIGPVHYIGQRLPETIFSRNVDVFLEAMVSLNQELNILLEQSKEIERETN